MFGIGISEILLISVLIFIFIKPKDLPSLLQDIKKNYTIIKQQIEAFKYEINNIASNIEREIVDVTKSDDSDSKNIVGGESEIEIKNEEDDRHYYKQYYDDRDN